MIVWDAEFTSGECASMRTHGFKKTAGFDMLMIPYAGTGDVSVALLRGDVEIAFGAISGIAPSLQQKDVKALAVTSAKRSAVLPNVPAVAETVPGYDASRIHHARIPAGQVHAVTSMLLGQTRAQRSQIGVMHPGRVDVIGAGALVLDRILTRLGFAEVVVSEHDILDGIAWSMADRRAG